MNRLKICLAMLCSGVILPVFAEPLLTYSIQRPPAFLKYQNEQWQTLAIPAAHLPRQASKIQLTHQKKVLYHVSGAKGWDWFELDPKTSTTKPVAKSSWFKQGFLTVLPDQHPDGSYYAMVHQRFSAQVYRVSAGGPKLFLSKPGLYGFVALSDGSYAYSTWQGQGKESADFIDYIPGRKMVLYHQPPKARALLLGKFDTVAKLQSAKDSLLFFTPGKTTGQKTWRLMALSTASKKAKVVAEIDKGNSRGTPTLISWPHSAWIAYAETPPQKYYAATLFMRHNLNTLQREPMGQYTSTAIKKGKGAPGFISAPRTDGAQREVATYDLKTGGIASRVPFESKKIYPERLIYLNMLR